MSESDLLNAHAAPTRQGRDHHSATDPPARMRETRRRQFLGLAPAVLTAPWLAACAGLAEPERVAPPASTQAASLRDGQSFRFTVINQFNRARIGEARYRVSASTGAGVKMEVELPASNLAASDAAPRRGMCELLDAAHLKGEFHFEGDLHFRDPEAWLPGPDGRAIQHRNAWRLGADPTWRRWDTRVSSDGWQRVRVPAGEFVALVVQREIWFDHPDTSRLQSRRQERLWHVPALGFWVRRELAGQYLEPSDTIE